VGFEIKTPWRDGTTHPEMTPVDVLERLAALVAVKGRRIFPSRGRSDFPTRLRRVVVV
jgi:hypothetical protein